MSDGFDPRTRLLPGLLSRRDLLGAGLAGAALWSGRDARAQAGATPELSRLPKIALLIGNSEYRSGALRNPGNDARALGQALGALGFETRVVVDADRATLAQAVETYVDTLARRRCTGLFFYAGHGVQLQWKNYLIPVDAQLAGAADLESQALALNTLVAGLTRAANPLNLVILDACRDNPFGNAGLDAQKGLGQMDAPRGSLLAFSTAPGNTASDGHGANGLYTENLLREIKVPGARVEDVFKRVRLAVRRASNGAQVPWESTSLEDDFYFLPPPAAPASDEATREREFAAELALWKSIENAAQPSPFEAYLRRYPSGQFSELAQLQLDRLLARSGERAVQPASQAGNPYSAGTERSDTGFKVGDLYRWAVTDLEAPAEPSRLVQRVTAVGDNEVEFNDGRIVTDLLGNPRRFGDGRHNTGFQQQPTEYEVGKTWSTRFRQFNPKAPEVDERWAYRIVRRERIEVPAGSFDCYRVEGQGEARPLEGRWSASLTHTYWMVPVLCRRPVAWETRRVHHPPQGPDRVLVNSRFALEFFQQSYGQRLAPAASPPASTPASTPASPPASAIGR